MSISHKEELGIMDMRTGMMAVTCEISKIDLYLKEPVMRDAIKLAIISPDDALSFKHFGIFERLHIKCDTDNLIMKICHIHRKI